MSARDTKSKSEGSGKKPYRSPKLVVYGDLRRLTKITSAKGGTKNDGGAPKTRL